MSQLCNEWFSCCGAHCCSMFSSLLSFTLTRYNSWCDTKRSLTDAKSIMDKICLKLASFEQFATELCAANCRREKFVIISSQLNLRLKQPEKKPFWQTSGINYWIVKIHFSWLSPLNQWVHSESRDFFVQHTFKWFIWHKKITRKTVSLTKILWLLHSVASYIQEDWMI